MNSPSILSIIIVATIGFLIGALIFFQFFLPRFSREIPPEESFKEYIERNDYKWLE